MLLTSFPKEALKASMACVDPPCSSPSGASSAGIADFDRLLPSQDWGWGTGMFLPGSGPSSAQWQHASSGRRGSREGGRSSIAQQQQQQQEEAAQSAGSGQPPSPSASTGWLGRGAGAADASRGVAATATAAGAAAVRSGCSGGASPVPHHQYQQQRQEQEHSFVGTPLFRPPFEGAGPSQSAPPQQFIPSEALPGFGDACWLDSFPLPDLFTEADPLALFPDVGADPLLPPLLPSQATSAAADASSGGEGPFPAGAGSGGASGLAPGQAQQSMGCPLSAVALAAAALGGGWQGGAQLALHVKQEGSGSLSARHRGSFVVGSPVAAAAAAVAEGAAGSTRLQHNGHGLARASKCAVAVSKGQGEGKSRKRGRPRLYDDPSAPDAVAASAIGPSPEVDPPQLQQQQQQQADEGHCAEAMQQQLQEQPATGRRGRGPKPKYVFGSREEAAGARRERNRKAALESYYRQREHVKGLEAERDRLLAENASLQGLLGHLQAGGACPLQELSDAGIDVWLNRA